MTSADLIAFFILSKYFDFRHIVVSVLIAFAFLNVWLQGHETERSISPFQNITIMESEF